MAISLASAIIWAGCILLSVCWFHLTELRSHIPRFPRTHLGFFADESALSAAADFDEHMMT